MSLQMQDPLLFLLLGCALGLITGLAVGLAIGTLGGRRRVEHSETHNAPTQRAETKAAAPTSRPAPARRVVAAAQAAPAAPAHVADLLLVDDSAVARAKLRKLFGAAGYQVHLASDGVEALALLEKGRYALMITDLEMPNMDGVTLINKCLSQGTTSGMPILAITGHDHLRAKFNECSDIAGVHRKPWVDDILLSHVSALVSKRQTQAAALVD
jgi:CheY-like chemotaxis protein